MKTKNSTAERHLYSCMIPCVWPLQYYTGLTRPAQPCTASCRTEGFLLNICERHTYINNRLNTTYFLHLLHTYSSCQSEVQTCAGHDAGSEAAIHAMRAIFEDNNTHATLLVDATNAFNLVNRQAALHNISMLCPSFSTILRNTYGAPIRLLPLVKVNLPPLKELLKVIHLPWLCMPLLSPH